jgi:hypothetical protein
MSLSYLEEIQRITVENRTTREYISNQERETREKQIRTFKSNLCEKYQEKFKVHIEKTAREGYNKLYHNLDAKDFINTGFGKPRELIREMIKEIFSKKVFEGFHADYWNNYKNTVVISWSLDII